jgi:AcrR family transcriptional regulator
MSQTAGLRERQKQLTRDLIAEAARRLFGERGFDAVTVADVAREAGVSQKTVFNHFPTKEDLFYSRMESFEEQLLDAIRRRSAGESILRAAAEFITTPRGFLSSDAPDAGEQLAALNRLIADSPALLAREERIYAGYTNSLAKLIAEETGARPGDIAPWVAANAIMGVHRALVGHVRRLTAAGERDPQRITAELREQADEALAALEQGL